MKKRNLCKGIRFVLTILLSLYGVSSVAQVRVFEESQARLAEPELKVFVRPLVADLEVLNNQERQYYGPFVFEVQSIDKLTDADLENFKATAMQRATRESEADLIIGATFNTYVESTSPNTVKIEIVGFPAKYVNFRPIGTNEQIDDYEMIRVVYPPTNKQAEQDMKTRAIN